MALTVRHQMTKHFKTWDQPEGLAKDNKKVWSSWTTPKNAVLDKWQLGQEISKQLPQSTVCVQGYSNMLTAFPTMGLREQDTSQQSVRGNPGTGQQVHIKTGLMLTVC